jgi:hypothetical protein
MPKEKLTIGRIDIVDLPDFGFINVPAKIDTGAYTSALHCSNIIVQNEEGVLRLSFNIQDAEGNILENHKFTTSEFQQKFIKSSIGERELRYVVKAKIVLFGRAFKTDFSLTNRTEMKFPVLIGRKLLKRRFVVDVSETNLSYKSKTSSHL